MNDKQRETRKDFYDKMVEDFKRKWKIVGEDPLVDIFSLIAQLHLKVDGIISKEFDEEFVKDSIISGIAETLPKSIEIKAAEINYDHLAMALSAELMRASETKLAGEGEREKVKPMLHDNDGLETRSGKGDKDNCSPKRRGILGLLSVLTRRNPR